MRYSRASGATGRRAACVFALAWAFGAGAAEQVLEDFESPQAPSGWEFWDGRSSPDGGLSFGAGHLGQGADPGFRLGPGDVVAASHDFQTPATTAAIALWLRPTPPDVTVRVQLTDAAGRVFQYQLERPLDALDAGAWYRAVVPLAPVTDPANVWGPGAHGVPQPPLTRMSLLAAGPAGREVQGGLGFDDITADTALEPQHLAPDAGELLPPPAGAGTLAGRLGVNVHLPWASASIDEADVEAARALGFLMVRTDLRWAFIERAAGVYDFTQFDVLRAALEARGMRMHLILGYDNALYADVDAGVGAPMSDAHFRDVFVPAFSRFASAAAAHFEDAGVTYEVWNEPNLPRFWRGVLGRQVHAADYATLFQAALVSIHAADPSARVSSAGLSGIDLPYLDAFLSAGGGVGADTIGVHPYRGGGGEGSQPGEGPQYYQMGGERLLADVLAMRGLIGAHPGAGAPLWNTEWGYSSTWGPGGQGDVAVGRAAQARFVARELLTAWAAGLPFIVHYGLRDDGIDVSEPEDNFGLLLADGGVKPAALAVQTLTSLAEGRTLTGFIPSRYSGLTAMVLDGPPGPVVAVWSTWSEPALTVTAPLETSVFDVVGAPLQGTRDGGLVSLPLRAADGPVYLVFPAPTVDGGVVDGGDAADGGDAVDGGADTDGGVDAGTAVDAGVDGGRPVGADGGSRTDAGLPPGPADAGGGVVGGCACGGGPAAPGGLLLALAASMALRRRRRRR